MVWLKKMLLKGFVEKIEMKINEIARTGDVLNDAVRLIFFAMFRHRITLSIMDHIYNSPVLRSWNRANPKRSIGPGVSVPKETIKAVLEPLETVTEQIRMRIKRLVMREINQVRNKWDDEEKLDFLINEIVLDLDPLISFVLVGSREEDRGALIRSIAGRIVAFAGMVDAIDMASLLSIELASAAERSALTRVMMHQNISGLLKEIPKLQPLMKKGKFRGTTVVVSIPRYAGKSMDRLKFRFSFYNDATDADTERRLMEDFTERNKRFNQETKLDDFFSKEELYGDNAMRFYYLTMLRQLCQKRNIIMNLGIRDAQSSSQDSLENASVTTLSFGL
jgi:hypothetical protein